MRVQMACDLISVGVSSTICKQWFVLYLPTAKVQDLIKTKDTIAVKAASIVSSGTPRAGKSTVIRRLTEGPSFVVTDIAASSTGLAERPVQVLIKRPTTMHRGKPTGVTTHPAND